MAPISWRLAGPAWVYALVWMLVLDQIKVTTYPILERRVWAAAELAEA